MPEGSQNGDRAGCYGMENGQKSEWEKNGKPNGKQPAGGQWHRTTKNGFLREFSIFSQFSGHFLAIFTLVHLGAVFSISFSIFFPFQVFGRFPCHSSPACVSWCYCYRMCHTGRTPKRLQISGGTHARAGSGSTIVTASVTDRKKKVSANYISCNQESAKGAGGKGARVINCHTFFFTPDRETRRIDHTTTEGIAERKMRQFATPAPLTPAPFRPF